MTADLQGSWLHPTVRIVSESLLAIFLSGQMWGFTADLIHAIGSADPAARAKLRHVFPREVIAWELRQITPDPPTAGELAEMLDEELKVSPRDRNCVIFDGGMFIRDSEPDQVRSPSCGDCGELLDDCGGHPYPGPPAEAPEIAP